MATVDQANNFIVVQSLDPGVYDTDEGPSPIDTIGAESVTLVLTIGGYATGESFGFYLEDSPDNVNYTYIPATSGLLVPLNANGAIDPQVAFPYSTSDTDYTITPDNDIEWINTSWWIGYMGLNRYIQPQFFQMGEEGGMAFVLYVILGWPHTAPTRLSDNNTVG